MSYCVNISCKQPQNFIKETVCKSCGSSLLLKQRYRVLVPLNK
ncbi:MAG: 4-Cys prefix domain-containing protein, partial [Microcoleaceae cyanobacterium]